MARWRLIFSATKMADRFPGLVGWVRSAEVLSRRDDRPPWTMTRMGGCGLLHELLSGWTGCDWSEVLIDRLPADAKLSCKHRFLIARFCPAPEVRNLALGERRLASFVDTSFLREFNALELPRAN
jgi:hypothetical protein